MLRRNDIVKITKGEDFEGNDISGKEARIINIFHPNSVNCVIEVDGMDHHIMFPKNKLVVVKRSL